MITSAATIQRPTEIQRRISATLNDYAENIRIGAIVISRVKLGMESGIYVRLTLWSADDAALKDRP
jgi:hypothetical protein